MSARAKHCRATVSGAKALSLFNGVGSEVCQTCLEPSNGSEIRRCKGPCRLSFHMNCSDKLRYCIKNENNSSKKKTGKKSQIPSRLPPDDLGMFRGFEDIPEIIMKQKLDLIEYLKIYASTNKIRRNLSSIQNMASYNYVPEAHNHLVQEEKWICSICIENKHGPCFMCGHDDDSEKIICCYCNKAFHEACSDNWPQCQKLTSSNGDIAFYCPQHVCHTCVSDSHIGADNKFLNLTIDNKQCYVRCTRCPATYHFGNYCIPAGSKILSLTQILCPAHYEPPNKNSGHASTSWCTLCSKGGDLICCDSCPNTFHVECLGLTEPPPNSFYCEDCRTGRYPLFKEIVWAKVGNFRWWPAKILFPHEIPDNVKAIKHRPGEFAVQFFGSQDYSWINRGHCFFYQEGDGFIQGAMKSKTDMLFLKSLNEAEIAVIKLNEERTNRDASTKLSMKPPKYIKISTNKPVGIIGKEDSVRDNQPCDCDSNKPDPCSSSSSCINRLLFVQCHNEICKSSKKCCNRDFEKRQYTKLRPFKTDAKGWGLKTLELIKKGSFIIEYVGELINNEEYQRRLAQMHLNKAENFYFLTIDKDRIIDAAQKGNLSRFMNHSCNPNCEIQKWTVKGTTRIGIFAIKDIQENEELVFDYNLSTPGNTKVVCKCRSARCTGYIGQKTSNKQLKSLVPVNDKPELPPKKKCKIIKEKSEESSSVYDPLSQSRCSKSGGSSFYHDSPCGAVTQIDANTFSNQVIPITTK